jgi:hypothetical protein
VFPETPYVAKVVDELERRALVTHEARGAGDDHLHAVFFLLQDVCGFSVPFTFKGALVPFSEGLANVVEDVNKSAQLVQRLKEEIDLRVADVAAIDRLAEISEPIEGFAGDKHRWQSLLAAYLFLAGSPMYMNGYRNERDSDFTRFYSRFFNAAEIGQAADYLRRENLAPAV